VANDEMRRYWSDVGAPGWVAHRRLFDAELARFAEAVIGAVDPGPGRHLLDVGCGTGALLELAVARGATGVGIDIAPAMVAAAAERVPGASFTVADAQTAELAGDRPFTDVVSRFGVMFFDDPVAAFANMRAATSTGASLAFACWRGADENSMFTLGTNVLLEQLDPPPERPAPGAPGPLGFADPDRVRRVLASSGWAEVGVEPFDAVCDYSVDGSDGVEERLTMILATSMGTAARAQLEPRLGPGGWDRLLDDVRAELRRNLVDGRVQFIGATWLVTATNPS
jgi:SAM-dependent methyltransferase